MARIRKEDHERILQLVDIERCAVREIAAEYNCTPANIYSLLTKLRRGGTGLVQAESEAQPPLALDGQRWDPETSAPPVLAAPVLAAPVLAAPVVPAPPSATRAAPPDDRTVVSFKRTAATPTREAAASPAAMKLGAKLAKPGMGLVMRSADGEETMTPFRSVDDLLSAIKPILRASARSPEPVWFSLQPVDLSAVDVDAA